LTSDVVKSGKACAQGPTKEDGHTDGVEGTFTVRRWYARPLWLAYSGFGPFFLMFSFFFLEYLNFNNHINNLTKLSRPWPLLKYGRGRIISLQGRQNYA